MTFDIYCDGIDTQGEIADESVTLCCKSATCGSTIMRAVGLPANI